MYAYRLRQFVKEHRGWQIKWLALRMRYIQRTKGSRYADWHFVKKVGIYPLETYNESYYADAVNFDLGMLMAHAGEAEKASRLLTASQVLPADGGDVIFSEHQRKALELYHQQQEAARRGMTSVLMASLPKSGSASLTQMLSELSGMPVFRLSVGHFPYFSLVESWAARLKSGGMLNHGHFGASSHNLSILEKTGVNQIVVHIRDPRAATLSYLNMQKRQRVLEYRNIGLHHVFGNIYLPKVQWIAGWMAAEKTLPWLKIHWSRFRDFKDDPWGCAAGIFDTYAENGFMRALADKARDRRSMEAAKANFHQGDNNAWREHASKRLRRRMWKALPKEVIEKLEMEY